MVLTQMQDKEQRSVQSRRHTHINVKLPLRLTKNNAMETYRGVEV